MLFKCSGKYIDIYFILKITSLSDGTLLGPDAMEVDLLAVVSRYLA